MCLNDAGIYLLVLIHRYTASMHVPIAWRFIEIKLLLSSKDKKLWCERIFKH